MIEKTNERTVNPQMYYYRPRGEREKEARKTAITQREFNYFEVRSLTVGLMANTHR